MRHVWEQLFGKLIVWEMVLLGVEVRLFCVEDCLVWPIVDFGRVVIDFWMFLMCG